MVAPTFTFHAGLPADCPLPDASAQDGEIFRAIRSTAAAPVDFESEAERKRKGLDLKLCIGWGLSVWTTVEHALHARTVIPGFEKKCIVKIPVTKSDGVLLKTPAKNQDEHHTFWKDVNSDFCAKSEVAVPKGEA
ncbi:hypothetical protein ACLBYG_20920 [Methylobacterium sp. D53M]